MSINKATNHRLAQPQPVTGKHHSNHQQKVSLFTIVDDLKSKITSLVGFHVAFARPFLNDAKQAIQEFTKVAEYAFERAKERMAATEVVQATLKQQPRFCYSGSEAALIPMLTTFCLESDANYERLPDLLYAARQIEVDLNHKGLVEEEVMRLLPQETALRLKTPLERYVAQPKPSTRESDIRNPYRGSSESPPLYSGAESLYGHRTGFSEPTPSYPDTAVPYGHSDSFLGSAVMGYTTGNSIIGSAFGGSFTGGYLGSQMK